MTLMVVQSGFILNPGEGMGVSKYIVPMRHESTQNSRQAASSCMWLVEGDELSVDLNTPPSPTENSLAVLNHKILEANSQVQNVKLGGRQTCLSINRLWHELCDMLRRLVGTTAPGHHDCSIQELKSE
ncbi:uncharacterized protein TNCV_1143341 [Trichonephila clavipes]|nr:uncharacterized protein TNCV_1143341 [Trichonephila clavipes]